MTIDPTNKFHVGDRVTLHEGEITEIVATYDPSIKVKFPSGQEDWFGVAEIATHTPKPKPKPIEVGDWVNVPYQDNPYQVRAIDEDVAWIKNRHGQDRHGRMWVHLDRLTPCEAPPPPKGE